MTQWKRPIALDPDGHTLDRFIERWMPVNLTGDHKARRAVVAATLLRLLPLAEHVEDIADEQQSIWRMPLTWIDDPNAEDPLIVVDVNGVVRTVLPPGAQKPEGR